MLSFFAIIVKTLTLSIEFFSLYLTCLYKLSSLRLPKFTCFLHRNTNLAPYLMNLTLSSTIFKPIASWKCFCTSWFLLFSTFGLKDSTWIPSHIHVDLFMGGTLGFKKMGLDLKLTRGTRGPYLKDKKIELKKNKLQP